MKHLLVAVMIFCGHAALSQATSDPKLTTEQLRADFLHFCTALQQAHPAMYRYTTKASFDSLFTSTQLRLNQPMTRHEFYKTMTPLLVALRDGHVKWIVPGRDQHYPFFNDRLFPLRLYFKKDRAWIAGSYGKSQLPAGAEVLSINGQAISVIMNKLLPSITFADGATITGKYHDLNHFFSGYYATYVEAPTTFEISYQIDQEQKKETIPAVSYEDITSQSEENNRPDEAFQLAFDESTRTAYLTIKRFWTVKGEKSFDAFLEQTFAQIKSNECKNLVLDLRDNEGGEEKYGIALYRYLAQKPFNYYEHISVHQKEPFGFPAYVSKLYRMLRWLVVKKGENGYEFTAQRGLKIQKPKQNAYSGKLYVLINGSSFSVTTEFAARVHADKRGTFIGQETGGAYEGNNSGIFAITQLPNSKIDLGIPMFGFYMADLPENLEKGQGIRPEFEVVPDIDDVLKNYDPALEFTRRLIPLGHASAKALSKPGSVPK